jgi:hypothetical protein
MADMLSGLESGLVTLMRQCDEHVAASRSMFAHFTAMAGICRAHAAKVDARAETRLLGLARRVEEQRAKLQAKLAEPPNVLEVQKATKELEPAMKLALARI